MIVIHLVSVMGGYWLFCGMEVENDKQLAEKFDHDNYAGSQSITIRLPLSVSASDDNNYKRTDGVFEYEGVLYKVVKQKIYRDTAYMVCVRDDSGKAIHNAMEDYVNSFSDKAQDQKSQQKVAGLFIKDYVSSCVIGLTHLRFGDDIATSPLHTDLYRNNNFSSPEYPPRIVA